MAEENQNGNSEEHSSLENCGEVVATESTSCEENPNQAGCSGPGPTPPLPNAEPAEPFLAPYDAIRVGPRELISTTRELNVFNRHLFYDGSSVLNTENMDVLRFVTRMLWSWNGAEERFIGGLSYGRTSVQNERFVTNESGKKMWQGSLKIELDGEQGLVPFTALAEYLIRERMVINNPFMPGVSVRKPDSVDTVFASPQPFFEKEMENVVASTSNVVSIKAEVGYYEEKPDVPEVNLPSLYRSYHSLITDTHEECLFDDTIQKFTSDSIPVMKEANESMKRVFNQYVEIKIGTQQGTKIPDFADEFQMDKYFLELVSSPNLYDEIQYAQVLDETMNFPSVTPAAGEGATVNDRYVPSVGENTTSGDPFYGLINNIKDRDQEFFESFPHHEYPLKFEYYNNPEALRFTDIIRSQLFMNNIESQIVNKSNIRSLQDIFSGEKAYSETIGYKISKHNITITEDANGEEIREVEEEPLQQFYLMDSNKVLDIEFVDTQVNAGKTYVYRIHSLNLVVGNSIFYDSPTSTSLSMMPARAGLELDYRCYPYMRIIEAPFFEKIVSVMERPPLAPQASFVPLQGVDNQMQILLRSNFGERELEPIKIFPQDQQIIDKMIESQPPRTDGLLEYQTDSLPEEFQILRIERPPESYNDFANAPFNKTLTTRGRVLMFIDDDFEPNKDYYYCFRAIDKIGISNPSHVYKIRTNSYLNGIYLDIKQYEMRPLIDTKFNLSIKRALKIEPAFNQTALSFPNVEDIDTPDFAISAPVEYNIGSGEDEDQVWGKKFKIRLTSKSSGRKIDINVTFDKEKKTIEPVSIDPRFGVPDLPTPLLPCGSTEFQVYAGNYGGETIINEAEPSPGVLPETLPGSIVNDTVFTPAFDTGLSITNDMLPTLEPGLNPSELPYSETNRLAEQAQDMLNQAIGGSSVPTNLGIMQDDDISGGVSVDGAYVLFENPSSSPTAAPVQASYTPTVMTTSRTSPGPSVNVGSNYGRSGY